MLDSGLALRSRLSALRFSLADDRWLRVADPPWWADGFAHLLPVLEGDAGEYRHWPNALGQLVRAQIHYIASRNDRRLTIGDIAV